MLFATSPVSFARNMLLDTYQGCIIGPDAVQSLPR
jgi:hypothetical protein